MKRDATHRLTEGKTIILHNRIHAFLIQGRPIGSEPVDHRAVADQRDAREDSGMLFITRDFYDILIIIILIT